MNLYNTLTRRLEVIEPTQPDKVTFYSCGPTVYDHIHIGNLRTFVFYDTLRRGLEATGHHVRHVMNITDVGHLTSDADEGEDKLEKGASYQGKSVWEVAREHTEAFKQDEEKVNILPPNAYRGKSDNFSRATDFIAQQIELVQVLLDRGFAYITEQAIYFDVSKLPSYGELTGQKLSDKEVGARSEVVTDSNKRHPYDFALWFFAVGRFVNHSMLWSSPWGEGFPGWHLECSAIIHTTLGDPIDIHTGAVDLIGTHHVNEMAQTEAAYGHKLARYWVHAEHMLVDGQKMSKSLGNTFVLDDVKKRGFNPLALRLLFLQAHYRSQTNFTWKSLAAAQQNLLNLYAWADLIHQSTNLPVISPDESKKIMTQIKEALTDDLNTSRVLSIVSDLTDRAAPNKEVLDYLEKILGIGLTNRADISQQQKDLIKEREDARKEQDWDKSDKLRTNLLDQSIEIRDTAQGPIWSRIK